MGDVAELQNYLQGDMHKRWSGEDRHCALPILANLLKRSLQAQKPKQRDLLNFWSNIHGERLSIHFRIRL